LELDNHLKKLMRDLGIAINDALAESSDLSEAIETVREAGYDVFLVLEATIGVHRRADGETPAGNGEPAFPEGSDAGDEAEPVQLKVNDQDMKFLKSLKIRVDDLDSH
jgi:hypothetical protein